MSIKGLLLDLSGVLYVGDQALPGAVETLTTLQTMGKPIRLLTNTTRTTSATIAEKLVRLGFDLPRDWIFTPPMAVRQYLGRHDLRPHLLIHPDLAPEFSGIDTHEPNALVMGDAGEYFDYKSLNEAFRILQAGATFIAMGDNRYFRDFDGLSLDIGPFVKALEYASDIPALIIGKPEKSFFLEAIKDFQCKPEEVLMVGDDALSDVQGALLAGLQAVLVKTGKYQPNDELKIQLPGWSLIDHINDLPGMLSHDN